MYHWMGFKLVPLGKDSQTPAVNSTAEVYTSSDFWTDEKLIQESYRFSNIATTFGIHMS